MPTFKESIAAGGRMVGQPRNDPIEIVPWDPAWRRLFEDMRARLAAALGDQAVRIDHVGSTSMPGMPAKPIIDIQISVPDVDDTDAYREQIEARGFGLRFIEAGHRYFRPPPPLPRLYQVHVCASGSDWERVHLLFRDYLRTHQDVATEYGRMKMRLANKHRNERIEYNDEKGPFIDAVVKVAEEWADQTGWTP